MENDRGLSGVDDHLVRWAIEENAMAIENIPAEEPLYDSVQRLDECRHPLSCQIGPTLIEDCGGPSADHAPRQAGNGR